MVHELPCISREGGSADIKNGSIWEAVGLRGFGLGGFMWLIGVL